MATGQDHKRRKRAIKDAYLDTLLESLTVDQLKTAIARLSRGQVPSARTHEEAIKAITHSGHSDDEIRKTLLDIEAHTPTRHCLLTSYAGSAPKFTSGFTPAPLPASSDQISFRLVQYAGNNGSPTVITAEHEVEVHEWKRTDEKTQKLSISRLRHPIFVRFYGDDGLALFCYPGYSQGSGLRSKHRLSYETVLSALIDDLSAHYELSFAPIAVESCLGLLQEASGKRVRIFRADLEGPHQGRISLASQREERSTSDVLVDLIGPYLPSSTTTELQSAVNNALREAPANSMVAYWIRESVITRVRFWAIGTDFLFIWHQTATSYRAIETILELLTEVSAQLSQPDSNGVWTEVVSLPPGQILLPGGFAGRFALDRESLRRTLVKATDAGLVEMVYRLRTSESLVEMINDWTPALSKLATLFTTESGEVIDGSDPASVEVAFRRVGGSPAHE